MKNIHGIEVKLAGEETAKFASLRTFNGFYIRRRTIRRATRNNVAEYRYDICHNNTLIDYNFPTHAQAASIMSIYYVRQTVERPLNF